MEAVVRHQELALRRLIQMVFVVIAVLALSAAAGYAVHQLRTGSGSAAVTTAPATHLTTGARPATPLVWEGVTSQIQQAPVTREHLDSTGTGPAAAPVIREHLDSTGTGSVPAASFREHLDQPAR